MLFLVISTVAVSVLNVDGRITHPRHAFLDAGKSDNPLLERTGLPRFADIKPQHIEPAVQERIKSGEAALKSLEAKINAAHQQSQVVPASELIPSLELIYDDFGAPWGLANHLQGVKDSEELRRVTSEMQPKVVEFSQKVSQSQPIYDAFVKLHADPGYEKLPEAEQRIISTELRDRKLSGVGLTAAKREEFNALQLKLSALSTNFSNNVLDATKAWNLTVSEKKRVEGIPLRALAFAAEKAKVAGHSEATAEKGPWIITLDMTMLVPVMNFAEDRSLREEVYRGYITLASTGKTNNGPIIQEILASRQRNAELLGMRSYADLSLESKMATQSEVHSLLDSLQTSAKPGAKADLKELEDFAKKTDGLEKLENWDKGFYVEKLRKQKFTLDTERMREYFAMPNVLDGLFALTLRLFDAKIEPTSDGMANVLWDKSVTAYRVSQNGTQMGYILLDPYERAHEKSGGAWANALVSRRYLHGDATLRLPVATVVCNVPSPQGSKPSLLSMDDVSTIFHEFGHALQVVLTRQNDTSVSGINGVEWDAVEISSMFMEYWLQYDKQTLDSVAKHYKTGEPLPDQYYKALQESKNWRAGTTLLGAVYQSKIDMRLHETYEKGEDVFAIDRDLATKVLVRPPLKEDRFLCSFSHIFAGGYSAGYYSYLWSQVLSADVFSAFEEAGLENPGQLKETGRRFTRTFFALGGGRAPSKVFKDFRGRKQSTDAMLRYSGLRPKTTGFFFF